MRRGHRRVAELCRRDEVGTTEHQLKTSADHTISIIQITPATGDGIPSFSARLGASREDVGADGDW